jgi:hypothetical protein
MDYEARQDQPLDVLLRVEARVTSAAGNPTKKM